VTFTALAFTLLERRLKWPIARIPALALLPLLLATVVTTVEHRWFAGGHLFASFGWLAWPVAIAAVIWILRRIDDPSGDVEGALQVRLDYWHADCCG
jgi:protein-S-isoprenylcysteine O-methyltransferase Ste14